MSTAQTCIVQWMCGTWETAPTPMRVYGRPGGERGRRHTHGRRSKARGLREHRPQRRHSARPGAHPRARAEPAARGRAQPMLGRHRQPSSRIDRCSVGRGRTWAPSGPELVEGRARPQTRLWTPPSLNSEPAPTRDQTQSWSGEFRAGLRSTSSPHCATTSRKTTIDEYQLVWILRERGRRSSTLSRDSGAPKGSANVRRHPRALITSPRQRSEVNLAPPPGMAHAQPRSAKNRSMSDELRPKSGRVWGRCRAKVWPNLALHRPPGQDRPIQGKMSG